MQERELIYDWNTQGDAFDYPARSAIELDDETLRDGLQSPSVIDPPIDQKIEILHMMAGLGIHTADIGLPGAGPRRPEGRPSFQLRAAGAPLKDEDAFALRGLDDWPITVRPMSQDRHFAASSLLD